MFTLIKGAEIFRPELFGRGDILLAPDKIAAIEENIEPPVGLAVEVIDARDFIATPGFIDLHMHLIGGGGEGGHHSRIPEIPYEEIVSAGITTAVGLLGTDDISKTPEALLSKVLGLEQLGLNAYMFSGAYSIAPLPTITQSLTKDIALIPHIIGVAEIALSDHRSSQPSFEELARITAQARVGGMLGSKAGLVQFHMGAGKRKMDLLFQLIRETEIPITQVLPTHVTKTEDLFEDAMRFAAMGGNLDITVKPSPRGVSTADALRRLREKHVPWEQITFSSDAGGSLPVFDENGNYLEMEVASCKSLNMELRRLTGSEGFRPESILACITANPAKRLKLYNKKGVLKPGVDGDLNLFSRDWELQYLYSRSRQLFNRQQDGVARPGQRKEKLGT